MTQTCENANSKLVIVADVDDEEFVGNSLVETLTLKIVHKISRLRFGEDFEVEGQLRF